MVDGTSKTEFSKLLQSRRKQMQLTQAALARQVAVSPILISYYERGHRTPRYETAHKIAEALRLEGEDREQFLSSLKFPLESSPDVNALLDELIRVFSSSSTSAPLKDKLAAELSSVLRDWREMQKKKVRWAVIPVAGWQARLLAPYATVHMIERVISEAETAGIDQVLIVLAPSQERVLSEKLLDRKRRTRIRLAVQSDQFGLGHAVLASRRFLPQNESFAVILPDDDLEESCLESMIDIYSREKCCVIAVRQVEETDEDSYGMVSVKQQSGSICLIEDLQEKPLDKFPGQSLAIIGRYIVTPDIFKALELTGANESGEIELTDAIRKMSETQPIYGHLYTGGVTSLSPSRRLLEKMILSRDKRAVEV